MDYPITPSEPTEKPEAPYFQVLREDISHLVDVIDVDHDRAGATAVQCNPEVIRFLAYTGLRWGEMAALRVGHFDMLRRRVSVYESVSGVKGRLHWTDAKTHERRSVPIPKFLVDELAALMVGKGRDDLVFMALGGGVLRVSTYRPRVFKPAVAAPELSEPGQETGAGDCP